MAKSVTNIQFHGEQIELHGDGTIFLSSHNALIVSDLHLEKGAALSQGAPLPQFDTMDTLKRLAKAQARSQPDLVICLGDSFHNTSRAFQMPPSHLESLNEMAGKSDVVWITGNHDNYLPERLPGIVKAELNLGRIRLCHEADGLPMTPTISGHYHPKARVKLRARRLSAPCFIQSSLDLIMPSFGSYTGGLSILDKALQPFIETHTMIHLCHDKAIYSLPFSPTHFTSSN